MSRTIKSSAKQGRRTREEVRRAVMSVRGWWGSEEGACANPTVFEQEVYQPVIYDHEGNPMTTQKPKLGFDLTRK